MSSLADSPVKSSDHPRPTPNLVPESELLPEWAKSNSNNSSKKAQCPRTCLNIRCPNSQGLDLLLSAALRFTDLSIEFNGQVMPACALNENEALLYVYEELERHLRHYKS